MEFPREMKEGSEGPHVTLLQGFFCGALPGSLMTGQLVYDQVFGGVTVQLVKEFQAKHNLSVTGNWDQATRGCARRELNFDFEAACRGISETSAFVQSDGSKVFWGRQ